MTATALLMLALAATPKTVQSPNGKTSVLETPVICPTKNEEARVAYNEGTELEKAGKIEESRKAYLKAIGLDPKYCDAMDNLGLSFRHAGELDAAIEWYRKSIAVAAKDGTARMNLGAALRMKKDHDGAAKEYAELIKVAPKDPEGHYGLGSVFVDQGKHKEAVKPLLEAEKLYVADKSPYVGDARISLAKTYYKLEDWAGAVKYLELLYPDMGTNRDLNLMLGTAYAKSKKADKAKEYLSKAKDMGATIPPDVAAAAGM